jgi:hypothetical protein
MAAYDGPYTVPIYVRWLPYTVPIVYCDGCPMLVPISTMAACDGPYTVPISTMVALYCPYSILRWLPYDGPYINDVG